jgi:glycosidase
MSDTFYWHRFFSHQPDLNYDLPEVRQEMLKVRSYWLDLGLDGFRCDAAPISLSGRAHRVQVFPKRTPTRSRCYFLD